MVGRVNARLEAKIRLTIIGPSGIKLDIDAVIPDKAVILRAPENRHRDRKESYGSEVGPAQNRRRRGLGPNCSFDFWPVVQGRFLSRRFH